MVLLGIFKKKT